jgi:hypothetical protein
MKFIENIIMSFKSERFGVIVNYEVTNHRIVGKVIKYFIFADK